MGEMGSRNPRPEEGRTCVARNLQHVRGSGPSLRRSRQAHPRRQGQAQFSGPPWTTDASWAAASQKAMCNPKSRDGLRLWESRSMLSHTRRSDQGWAIKFGKFLRVGAGSDPVSCLGSVRVGRTGRLFWHVVDGWIWCGSAKWYILLERSLSIVIKVVKAWVWMQ